ncbi:MAG TPA: mechanosensitive ion channel family protein [Candidatus Binatia bacterium]|jgi:MscS family membrane protein
MSRLWIVVVCVLVAAGSFAQEPSPAPDVSGNTPRSALRGYLTASRAGDYERAATYLDLRSLPPARRAQGARLAMELQIVLDRTLWIDVDSLSDEPEGATDDGLPGKRDLVGTIWAPSGRVDVFVDKVGGENEPAWKITGGTMRQVPTLYADFGYGRLTEILPSPFFDVRFLDVQLWQWLGLLAVALGATALAWLLTAIVLRIAKAVLARSRRDYEAPHLPLAVGPARLLIAALIVDAALAALALPVPAYRVMSGTVGALLIVAAVWLLLRLTDVFAHAAERRLAAQTKQAAAGIVPLGRRAVKVVLTVIAVLATLENFGFNVTGVLAALGVGGLAVALAAQKTVENLFGGVSLIVDQPVRVGDLCRFGDRTGTVEDIGLRSTRIRTPERTVIAVPNADFSGMQLENFARRDRMWLQARLGLHYEASGDQMRTVLSELRKLLLGNPKVDADSAQVRFVAFGATALEIEVSAYVRTTDAAEFGAIREDLFLRMMDVIAASGVGFAAAKTVVAPPPSPS